MAIISSDFVKAISRIDIEATLKHFKLLIDTNFPSCKYVRCASYVQYTHANKFIVASCALLNKMLLIVIILAILNFGEDRLRLFKVFHRHFSKKNL